MADDIVTRLRTVVAVPNGVDIWTMTALDAADEIVRLRAVLERLTVESEEEDADTERYVARMAGLLHDIANALHGAPLPGGVWSWHDLPTIATAERALADQLGEALAMAKIVLNDHGLHFPDNSGYAVALDAWQEARRG